MPDLASARGIGPPACRRARGFGGPVTARLLTKPGSRHCSRGSCARGFSHQRHSSSAAALLHHSRPVLARGRLLDRTVTAVEIHHGVIQTTSELAQSQLGAAGRVNVVQGLPLGTLPIGGLAAFTDNFHVVGNGRSAAKSTGFHPAKPARRRQYHRQTLQTLTRKSGKTLTSARRNKAKGYSPLKKRCNNCRTTSPREEAVGHCFLKRRPICANWAMILAIRTCATVCKRQARRSTSKPPADWQCSAKWQSGPGRQRHVPIGRQFRR